MNPKNRILAIHVYNEGNLEALLGKVKVMVDWCDKIILTSSNCKVLTRIGSSWSGKAVEPIKVSNSKLDWSGYLKLFSIIDDNVDLFLINDSIVNRRILSFKSISYFFDVATNGYEGARFVGELDTCKESVNVNGFSNISWISSFLMYFSGVNLSSLRLEVDVHLLNRTLNDHKHYFNIYLSKYRGSYSESNFRNVKIETMFLERLLTQTIQELGIKVIDAFAGSKYRKLEKRLELFIKKN